MLPVRACVGEYTDVLLREYGNTQPEIAELTGSVLSKLGARQQRRERPKIETNQRAASRKL
jgi:hypothetical protein